MTRKFNVTLDNCHEEPIHIPGAVQPHGMLIVVDPPSGHITHITANVKDLTGKDPLNCLNKPLHEVVGQENSRRLMGHLKIKESGSLMVDIPGQNQKVQSFTALIHQYKDRILIDLETGVTHTQDLMNIFSETRSFTLSMPETAHLETLYERTVTQVRKLTGYDRVMIYKFDEENNGEIVAEAKRARLNSFLHQHFPESDIPAQARQLYIRNKIRLIADVSAVNSPLITTLSAEPVDLSFSTLRSVSPIHIQYLKNMGVQATMSVSIVVDDRLWGMLVCHHYTPAVTPYSIREAVIFIGLMLSHQINVNASAERRILEADLNALNSMISAHLAESESFSTGVKEYVGEIMVLTRSTGVVIRLESSTVSNGAVPDHPWIERIAQWARSRISSENLYFTKALAREEPSFEAIADKASGILFLPLTAEEYVLWFRKEVIETKNWGGKPEKHIEFLDDGSHRLMPRSSFRLWQENVRNKSFPWLEEERSIALRFRNNLLDYILLKTERLRLRKEKLEGIVRERTNTLQNEMDQKNAYFEELQGLNVELRQSNQDLEQFAYVASHDLQEPLRKIQAFGERIQEPAVKNDPEKFNDYVSRMIQASSRMRELIDDLLTFSRLNTEKTRKVPISLSAVIDQARDNLHMRIQERKAVVKLKKDVRLYVDFSQFVRLFQNLIHNSIKFTDDNTEPHIDVNVKKSGGRLVISLHDNGIGIGKEYHEKVFGLFERLHERSKYEGTGLGLAICRRIIERHGGTIGIQGEEGEGTTISMSLPPSPK